MRAGVLDFVVVHYSCITSLYFSDPRVSVFKTAEWRKLLLSTNCLSLLYINPVQAFLSLKGGTPIDLLLLMKAYPKLIV